MAKIPHFGNLEKLASKCALIKSDNLIINKTEAQHIAMEYQKLLGYITQIQDELLAERERQATEIEILGPNF